MRQRRTLYAPLHASLWPVNGNSRCQLRCPPLPSRSRLSRPRRSRLSVGRIQFPRLAPRAPVLAPDGRQFVDQRQELGDMMAVFAGQRPAQRRGVRIGQYVVLRARPCTVNRASNRLLGCTPARPTHARRRRRGGRSLGGPLSVAGQEDRRRRVGSSSPTPTSNPHRDRPGAKAPHAAEAHRRRPQALPRPEKPRRTPAVTEL